MGPPEAQTNTHTHTIYAVRRVYSAGAQCGFTPRRSHRLASASLAPCQNPPPPTRTRTPHPHPSECPQISQLAQAARAWRRPVSPPSGEGTVYGHHGAYVTCRAAHRRDQRRGHAQARLRAPGEQDRRVCAESRLSRPQVKRMLVPSALRTVWP